MLKDTSLGVPARAAGLAARVHKQLVLQAGPAVVANGNDYPQISTRGEDPAPLSTGELSAVFRAKDSGPPRRG